MTNHQLQLTSRMKKQEVVDSDVDNDSLSDVGVDVDNLAKEQATILFCGACC
jgi:hypothetical protein